MKSIFRVMRVFSLFGLIFLFSFLNSYALAKGPEKSGEEALKAEAEKALQAKVERLKSDYKGAVSLYNQGRREEARNRFLRIAADAARNDLDPSNDLYLGYWVERGLRRYLQRSEQKIGQATEAEQEARKKAEAEKKLEVEAGRQAEAERAYKEKVKKVLQQDFQTAERFYKQKRFLEAKPLLEKVARQKETVGVSLGLFADRRLRSYLSNIDEKIAEREDLVTKKAAEKEKMHLAEKSRAQAEQRRLAREQEERKAEATSARARQEKFALLKARYEEAVVLYKKGQYQQAKQFFLSVERDKGDLNLGPEMEEGLKKYLVRIDEDVTAKGQQGQLAKLESGAQADQERRKAWAELYYRDAKNNYERRAFNRALEDAKRALEFDPEHKESATLLAEIESALGPGLPERETAGSMAGKVLTRETVARQRYEKLLSERLTQAKVLIEEEKYEEALTHLNEIKNLIQFAPIPPSDVIDEIKKEVEVLLPQVQAKAREAQRLRRQIQLEEAKRIADMERERWEEIREEQISQEIELAKLFMERKEFDKAEAILKAVLMQDSNEPRALVLLEVVRTEDHMDKMAKLREQADWEFREHRVLGAELTIPWRDVYVYPSADIWRLLTERRKDVATLGLEPPTVADLKVEENLKQFITFDFTDTPFGDVIDFIRTVADINIVIDSAVLTPADLLAPVTLRLTDVTIEGALRHLLFPMALDYLIKDGALFISDVIGVQQRAEPVQGIYDIRDLTATVTDFTAPSLGFGGGGGIGGEGDAPGFGDAPRFGDAPSTVRMDAFAQAIDEFEFEEGATPGAGVGVSGVSGLGARATTPEQAGFQTELLVRQLIDPDRWFVAGNSIVYRDGLLIVMAPPATHKKIDQLLDNMRKIRAVQVQIDIRFIRCTDEFVEQVGVEIWLQRAGEHASYYGETIGSIGYDVQTGITPLTAPFSWVRGIGPAGHGLGIVGEHSWSQWEVAYFLSFVQKSRQAQVMTAPRVTLFNGQRGYVAVIREITYVSDFDMGIDTEVTTVAGLPVTITTIDIDVETSTVRVGVVFDVRPTVSSDRRYVHMDLAPTLLSHEMGILDLTQYGQEAGVVFLPHLVTTEVRDAVSVPDGGTILVGGLLYTEEIEGETGIPILSKLPFIGWLFGRRAETYTMDHMLILVTPHIILQEEAEERVLKEAL